MNIKNGFLNIILKLEKKQYKYTIYTIIMRHVYNQYLQYKHMRRYMEALDNYFLEVDHYKHFRKMRQENDYWIKKSFYKEPYVDPFKEYKQIRQLNEFYIKNRF